MTFSLFFFLSYFFNILYDACFCVGPDSGLKVSNELVASIQSIAAFLQHRKEEDGPYTGCSDQLDNDTHQAKQSKVSKQLFITRLVWISVKSLC